MPLLFISINLFLYLLWKVPATHERYRRPDGKKIPFYFSSTLGDTVGFSLLAYAFGTIALTFAPWTLGPAVFSAIIVMWLLDTDWSRNAKKKTVGLYLRSGKRTRAGNLHLAYVAFGTLHVALFLLNYDLWTFDSALVFFLGGMTYLIACALDGYSGAI